MKIFLTGLLTLVICVNARAEYYNCNFIASTSIITDPYFELKKNKTNLVERLISMIWPGAKYEASGSVTSDPNSNLKFEITNGKAFIYGNSSKAELTSLRNNYYLEDNQGENLHFWKFFPATKTEHALLVSSKAYSMVSAAAFQSLYECHL